MPILWTLFFAIIGALTTVTATSFEHDICFCNSEVRSAVLHRFRFLHEQNDYTWLEACVNRLPREGRGPCMRWQHVQGDHCKGFPDGTGICYGHKQLSFEGHTITFDQYRGSLPRGHRQIILMECEDVCREHFGPGKDRCDGPECPMDHTWHGLTSMCNYTDGGEAKALGGDEACKMTLWENVRIPGLELWKGPGWWMGYGPSITWIDKSYRYPYNGLNYKTTIG